MATTRALSFCKPFLRNSMDFGHLDIRNTVEQCVFGKIRLSRISENTIMSLCPRKAPYVEAKRETL
jgi:hypothetical protein